MKTTIGSWFAAAGIFGAVTVSAAVAEQRFEAEKVLLNQEALQENKMTETKWNLWSTDTDAAKKWSGGVVIQSAPVKQDVTPGSTAPILKFSIPMPESGKYDILGGGTARVIGLSTDGGKTWKKYTGGVIAENIDGSKGAFEFQMSNCFVFEPNPGSCYIDYFSVVPAGSRKAAVPAAPAPKTPGFDNPSFEVATPAPDKIPGWTFWKRDAVDSKAAVVADDARSGKAACRITALGTLDWAFTNRTFPVVPGESFEFSGWVKNLTDQPFSANIQIVSNKDKKVVSYTFVQLEVGSAGKEWKEFKGTFTVPAGVDAITVRMSGRGKADFLVDDFDVKSTGKGAVPAPAPVPAKSESVAPQAAPAASGVLVANGDFELGSIGGMPQKWAFWKRENLPDTKAVLVGEAKNGQMACRIVSVGERDWAFNAVAVKVNGGESFKLTLQAKSNTGASADASMQISSFKDGKTVIYGSIPLKGLGADWKEYTGVIAVPKDAGSITFRLIGQGKCDISLDDFKAELTTEQPAAAAAAAKPAAKPLTEYKPVNGFAKDPVTEKLDRGLVATGFSDGVYLSWRLLAADAKEITFDLFRIAGGKETKLNTEPIRQTTDFLDKNPVEGAKYAVRPAAGFTGLSGEAAVRPQPYQSFVLSDPKARIDKVGIGDLDGDGKYDYVARIGTSVVDPYHLYWKKSPETYKLEAFTADGKRLWTKDLGWNIEQGIWYSPFIVYDFNGDGKAEVALKMGDDSDLRDAEGKVKTGNEYLAVLDGMTGKVIAKAPWPGRDGFGDPPHDYNFFSRNQLAVAYLDGKTPCLIPLRGTYTTMKAEAWQLKGDKLEQLWTYCSNGYGKEFRGQGSHSTRIGDIDGDGRDEIVLGSAVLDDDGRPLWSTGHGHPDYLYLTDITNANPGLEIVTILETACREGGGMTVADAKTGKVVWELKTPTSHMHYGYAADLDPRYQGFEVGGIDTGNGENKTKGNSWLFTGDGKLLQQDKTMTETDSIRTVYWDADLQREILRNAPAKFQGGPAGGLFEGNSVMVADVSGDWREEIITSNKGEFRVYSTLIPAMDRRTNLMQDHIYRMAIVTSSMGYTYDPTLTYLPANLSPNLNLTLLSEGLKRSLRVTVSAPLEAGLAGELKLFAPGGMEFDPVSWKVDLKPGAIEVKDVAVKVTGSAKAPIRAELTLADGVVLRGQVATAVTPPTFKVDPPAGFAAEAEDYINEKGGSVEVRTDKIGTHLKSISHWDKKGHELSWKINLPRDGRYVMQVRYCSSGTATRSVSINGEKLGSFTFPGTGGNGGSGADWDIVPVGKAGGQMVLELKAGEQLITFSNDEGGMMNVDYLSLVPVKN
ncbi:MAG: carbohydrate binding domain-containing protein [Victivallaceae bacterium]